MKKVVIVVASVVLLILLVLVANYFIFGWRTTLISTGTPIVRKDPVKQALLVIDIQEGLTGKSSMTDFFIERAEGLIRTVNRITDSSASHGIPVIYIKNEITDPLINILNNSMAEGSPGAGLDSRLRVVSQDVLGKQKGDAFSNPLLDTLLVRQGINTLVFVGLDLSQCVASTIKAGVNRNYRIRVISDAVLNNPDSLKAGVLERMRQDGCDVMTSDEYCERILE
jgi:nicotinamidase/pyrazinamidase